MAAGHGSEYPCLAIARTGSPWQAGLVVERSTMAGSCLRPLPGDFSRTGATPPCRCAYEILGRRSLRRFQGTCPIAA